MSLNKLKKIARRSDHRNYKHGAIVIRGGAIISSGYNHGLKHAEVHAVEKLWPGFATRSTVITIRLTRTGFGISRPCDQCYRYMRGNGVRKVIYMDREGSWVREKL